jgi:hypothetical protein
VPEAPLEQNFHEPPLVCAKDIKITMSDKAIQSALAAIAKDVTEMRAEGAAASLRVDDLLGRLGALSKAFAEHKLQNDAKFASQRDLIDTLTNDLDTLKGVELDVKDFKEMVGIQFSALANKSGDRKADPDVVMGLLGTKLL